MSSFAGMLPSLVRHSSLSDRDKVIYAEMTATCPSYGYVTKERAESMANHLNLEIKQIYNSLQRLCRKGFIVKSKDELVIRYSFCKADEIQEETNPEDEIDRPPKHSIEELKELKKIRKLAFWGKVHTANQKMKYKMPEVALIEFAKHWCESGDEDRKMKFEKQKSWNTFLRMETWQKKNYTGNCYLNGEGPDNKVTISSKQNYGQRG